MHQHEFMTDAGVVNVRFSDRSDGSFALDEPADLLAARRARLVGSAPLRQWVAVRQVHGAAVHRAAPPAEGPADVEADTPEADAIVCFDPDLCVSVLTADCAPVVLVGSTGVAVVHAGWRGAAAGVVGEAADLLRAEGARPVAAILGPCIQPAAYEFGTSDLEPIVAAFGSEVVGRTAQGSPGLDLTRVIQISCERAGWPAPQRPTCTSSPSYFSHRTRADTGRHAAVAWISADETSQR